MKLFNIYVVVALFLMPGCGFNVDHHHTESPTFNSNDSSSVNYKPQTIANHTENKQILTDSSKKYQYNQRNQNSGNTNNDVKVSNNTDNRSVEVP